MGSAAEVTEPTTGTEKHQPRVQVEEEEEEDEHIVELERKTSLFRHGKGHDTSADTSTITTTNTSSSSSSSIFSGDGTEGMPDFRNGQGDHTTLENLEVPESPEQETVIGFHDEQHDGNNSNVYFDGEQAGTEPDAHESQTAELNGEKKPLESENGSTSEDNKVSREIEEVKDGDVSKDLDAVNQPAGGVIEEDLDIEDVEDYDVENVLGKQETHDLFCPNCDSCITKRVVLKRRKRRIRHELGDSKRVRGPEWADTLLRSEDNLPSPVGGENSAHESFMFKCLSCFTIFIPSGMGSKPIPPGESVEGLKSQPKPQEEATGNSNWFSSVFGLNKKGPAVQQGDALPSVPEAIPPRDILSPAGQDTTGSTANNPSKAPTIVQRGVATSIQDGSEISSPQDIKPVDTPSIQVANSHDTSEIVNHGAIVEDGQKFPAEEQKQQKIDKDDSSPADGNHTSDKGRLSPIHPSHGMSILNTVTNGPGGFTVKTEIHEEGTPLLFEGKDTSDTRTPDFGVIKVTGVNTSTGGVSTSPANPEIDISPGNILEEGSLREPLMIRVVQGRKIEILKSIVYGGLIESITSLGVISSAAGSGASLLNILVLGLANLLGGLILIIHNLQELREEEPRRTTTEDNQTGREEEEGRYKRLLGRRENFTLHASVAIISFIIVGLLPPVVYYFSFNAKHNKDYKVASVFGVSLACIVLLAIAKAHVKYPRGSYLKSILYYATIAVSVSGISYAVGSFLDHLLEKYGWSDGSETPVGEMMLSSLMGRKAGLGYS